MSDLGLGFRAVPVLNSATVTTAAVVGDVSRATSGCSAPTAAAAATTGSTARCGMAPWPPRPTTLTQNLSAAAIRVPACSNKLPLGGFPA